MRLWKTPERLRRVALLLYGVLPLAFFASLVARRMPWWQWNPTEEWPVWAGAFLGVSFLVLAIVRTYRFSYALVAFLGGAMALLCLLDSIRQENVGLGLFSVAFGIVAFAYVDRLGSAFETPAIRPGLRWFQSLPEPIPGVTVDWGDQRNLRLSKLDLEGGFVLGTFPRGAEKNLPTEIVMHYRGSKMGCEVRVLTSLDSKIDSSWAGIGVEFKNTDRDTRKELSDFIEVLRGEGHVST
jgi:hypothetical protein